MVRRRSTRIAAAVLAVSVAAGALVGCGSDADDGAGDETSAPADRPSASSTTHPATEATTANGAESGGRGVVAFDVPSEVACVPGTTAEVEVTYRTRGLQAVALVVDGQTQPGADTAPSGDDAEVPGRSTVMLPCDGNVHTVMLIGSGADGPAFASKAVVTGAA